MSVVGPDYDKLRRYNLAELYNPAPKSKAITEPPKIDEKSSKELS